MKYTCVFDPKRDIAEVITADTIDLSDCIETGIIPPSADLSYNEIDDISKVGERPDDMFEAMRMKRAIQNNPRGNESKEQTA